MKAIEWDNQVGSRGREPFLLFVRGDQVLPFSGKDIAGVVVVKGTDYEKNGKWSHTTYRLQVADNVRCLAGRMGWEKGTLAEGLQKAAGVDFVVDTWPEVAQCLGISVVSAMKFMRENHPKEAEDLDVVERELEKLDDVEHSAQIETTTVSFGGPSNREISEGYWEAPKPIKGFEEANICLIEPSNGWGDRENIRIVGVTGVVTSTNHVMGMHGGYYAVEISIIPEKM
jgi:hypothetical protein